MLKQGGNVLEQEQFIISLFFCRMRFSLSDVWDFYRRSYEHTRCIPPPLPHPPPTPARSQTADDRDASRGLFRGHVPWCSDPGIPWGAADPLSNSFPHYIKLHSGVIAQPCLTFDQKSPDARVSPHKNTPAVQLDSQQSVLLTAASLCVI